MSVLIMLFFKLNNTPNLSKSLAENTSDRKHYLTLPIAYVT